MTQWLRPDLIDPWLRSIALAIEVIAVLVLVAGAAIATGLFLRNLLTGATFDLAFHRYRAGLARSLVLAVEFLVAADLIGTVVVEPTFSNLAVLGLIVLIRTFLSFSLEIEIQGRLPWRRRDVGKAPTVASSQSSDLGASDPEPPRGPR